MANVIHPTAIVDPTAQLGSGNVIGPFCLIGPGVCIGNNNRFEAGSIVGTPPEHDGYWSGSQFAVFIGDNCIIREKVTIQSGTKRHTRIENGCWLLTAAYVAHDCVLEEKVVVSAQAALGGFCYIYRGANIGMGARLHQRARVGHYAMLGMQTVVTKTSLILPGQVYIGAPAKRLKKNAIGLKRNKISDDDLKRLEALFRLEPPAISA